MSHAWRLLESPRTPWAAALLAVVLCLPSLGVGWQADDHLIRSSLLGAPGLAPGAMEGEPLFTLTRGEPGRNAELRRRGIVPWWTADTLRLAFWRPLAGLSHRFDEALAPGSALMAHAHSLVWLALLVLAVGGVYRRLSVAGAAAGLATLLYAVDDARGVAVGWIASRNVLMAATLGMLALLAHVAWRREGWRPGALLAPLALAAALLSAEGGLATCAWLFAFALCLDRGAWRDRLLSLLPAAVVVVAWRAVYQLQGFGASGGSFYVDPVLEPLAFVEALLLRLPLLAVGLWALPPSDAASVLDPGAVAVMRGVGVALIVMLGVLFAPLLRALPAARFYAVGMLLSLVPLAAVQPGDRLLVFAGLGAMGLLALLLDDWRRQGAGAPLARRLACGALAVVHLVLAPLALPFSARSISAWGEPLNRALRSWPELEATRPTLVMVTAPDFFHPLAGPVLAGLDGRPGPERVYALSLGTGRVVIERLDARTLEAGFPDGLPVGMFAGLFRNASNPMRQGQRVSLEGLSVEVLQVRPDGLVGGARFAFETPLDDERLGWLRWGRDGFIVFRPPDVGERVELPGAITPFLAGASGRPLSETTPE